MFRAFFLTCVGLLAAVLGAYRHYSHVPRADFAYVNPSGINTLDPAAMTWMQDYRIAINVWEGLTSYHPETAAAIDGAAYPPEVSNDGLHWTFTIRPEARWSNGDPVTAADFVRGWRRAMEPGSAGDNVYLLVDYIAGARDYYDWRNQAIESLASIPNESDEWRMRFTDHAAERDARFEQVGVRAVEPRTLDVTLRHPCVYFLDLCAMPAFVPIHESIERLRIDHQASGLSREGLVIHDPQWTKPNYHANGYPGLITNGAYRVSEWTFKRRLRLTANPFFHQRHTVRCETIDMLVYGDVNTSILAYEAGDVDFLPEMNVTYDHELARLAHSGERPDIRCPIVFGSYYYLFNCEDATFDGRPNPFIDARVRKAFALAVDRRLIAEKVVSRGDPPMGNIVPPGTIAGYEAPAGLGHDPEEARRLLAEAGYPDGRGLPVIDILYNTGFHHGKICDVMSEMWRRELGATVSPRGKETKTFAEDRKHRRFMIARAGWYGDYADPTTYLDLYTTGNGNNDSGYSDPRYDGLMRRAAGERNHEARYKILAAAERMLVRDALPLLPLYQYTQVLAIKPCVRGLHPNPRLVFPFRYLSISP